MKFIGYKRYAFTAQFWLPVDDQAGEFVLLYQKDVQFDFTDDPLAPRQEVVSDEPFPIKSRLTFVTDRYGVEPLPGSSWNVTTIEPIIGPMGQREAYRHQVALHEAPDFGYENYHRG